MRLSLLYVEHDEISYLDPLAPVDDGVAPVGVHPADREVGVALREDVLLVQVGAGDLEADLVLEAGLLLKHAAEHAAVAGLALVRAQPALILAR